VKKRLQLFIAAILIFAVVFSFVPVFSVKATGAVLRWPYAFQASSAYTSYGSGSPYFNFYFLASAGGTQRKSSGTDYYVFNYDVRDLTDPSKYVYSAHFYGSSSGICLYEDYGSILKFWIHTGSFSYITGHDYSIQISPYDYSRLDDIFGKYLSDPIFNGNTAFTFANSFYGVIVSYSVSGGTFYGGVTSPPVPVKGVTFSNIVYTCSTRTLTADVVGINGFTISTGSLTGVDNDATDEFITSSSYASGHVTIIFESNFSFGDHTAEWAFQASNGYVVNKGFSFSNATCEEGTGYNYKVTWLPRVGSDSGNLTVTYNLNGSLWYTMIPAVDYTVVLSIAEVVDVEDTDLDVDYGGMVNSCFISSTVNGGSDKYLATISVTSPQTKTLLFNFYMDKQQQTIYDESETPIEDVTGTTENWLQKIADILRDIIDLFKGILAFITSLLAVAGSVVLLVVGSLVAFISFFVSIVGTFIYMITSFAYTYISFGSLGLTFPAVSWFPVFSVTGIDTVLQWLIVNVVRRPSFQLIWGTIALFGFVNRYVIKVPVVGESGDFTIGSGDLDE
jgi:hypothetical protein